MTPVRAAATAAALLLFGCRHVEEAAAPAGIPYACLDGRTARIVFDGGDPNRSPAHLQFEGREFTMAPVPAMSGLRYRSEAGLAEGRSLVWSAEGDAAVLSDEPSDPASAEGEREIVRCTRLREGDAPPPPEPAAHGS